MAVFLSDLGSQPSCFNGAATARSRMGLRSRCPTSGSGRFNGAATARSRMEAKAKDMAAALPCFNGAATARSRMA